MHFTDTIRRIQCNIRLLLLICLACKLLIIYHELSLNSVDHWQMKQAHRQTWHTISPNMGALSEKDLPQQQQTLLASESGCGVFSGVVVVCSPRLHCSVTRGMGRDGMGSIGTWQHSAHCCNSCCCSSSTQPDHQLVSPSLRCPPPPPPPLLMETVVG